MKANSNAPLKILLSQLLIFAVGLLDDLLLLAFSHWGLHVPWLQWIAPIILGGTILHSLWQLLHHPFWIQKEPLTDSATA